VKALALVCLSLMGCASAPPAGSIAPALIVVRCFAICRVVIVTERPEGEAAVPSAPPREAS
jgi:hypothetical protein